MQYSVVQMRDAEAVLVTARQLVVYLPREGVRGATFAKLGTGLETAVGAKSSPRLWVLSGRACVDADGAGAGCGRRKAKRSPGDVFVEGDVRRARPPWTGLGTAVGTDRAFARGRWGRWGLLVMWAHRAHVYQAPLLQPPV